MSLYYNLNRRYLCAGVGGDSRVELVRIHKSEGDRATESIYIIIIQ